jgi:hypothetical protein
MLEQRALSEGSNESVVMAETLTWQVNRWPRKKIRISLGPAEMVRSNLGPLLASRISRGQQLRITSGGRTLEIRPGEPADWEATDNTLTLTVSPALIAELEAFLAKDEPALQSRSLPDLVLALVG